MILSILIALFISSIIVSVWFIYNMKYDTDLIAALVLDDNNEKKTIPSKLLFDSTRTTAREYVGGFFVIFVCTLILSLMSVAGISQTDQYKISETKFIYRITDYNLETNSLDGSVYVLYKVDDGEVKQTKLNSDNVMYITYGDSILFKTITVKDGGWFFSFGRMTVTKYSAVINL